MHLETRLEATGAPQGLHDLANQLIGASPRMGMARALIAKVAANDSTVLITGESGTGKSSQRGRSTT